MDAAVQFGGRGLIEFDTAVEVPDRLEQMQRPNTGHLRRRNGLFE